MLERMLPDHLQHQEEKGRRNPKASSPLIAQIGPRLLQGFGSAVFSKLLPSGPLRMGHPGTAFDTRYFKGYRNRRTRYEKGEIIFELEPEGRPEAPQGHKLMRRGFRWRDVRTVAIGLKPVVLRVKVPRWLNTTTGEEFEQSAPLSKPTRKSRGNSGA